jgi:hypothetical protein
LADEGDDGDPHPEGIEVGGVAVIGEGVEAEVDAIVKLQVLRARKRRGKFDAGGGDSSARDTIARSGAVPAGGRV